MADRKFLFKVLKIIAIVLALPIAIFAFWLESAMTVSHDCFEQEWYALVDSGKDDPLTILFGEVVTNPSPVIADALTMAEKDFDKQSFFAKIRVRGFRSSPFSSVETRNLVRHAPNSKNRYYLWLGLRGMLDYGFIYEFDVKEKEFIRICFVP